MNFKLNVIKVKFIRRMTVINIVSIILFVIFLSGKSKPRDNPEDELWKTVPRLGMIYSI